MSSDPLSIAKQAEQDLNSTSAKQGHDGKRGASDSTLESGIDASVTNKFPGSTVQYGSSASGDGNNRDIALEEGGGVNPATGKLYKAGGLCERWCWGAGREE